MKIQIGYDMVYECPRPTPMILILSTHYSRAGDLVFVDNMKTDPPVPVTSYRDSFGNWCSRIVAPQGSIRIYCDAVVRDSGQPDAVAPDAEQVPVEQLPEQTLMYLLGSRYCETDHLLQHAWRLFGQIPPGWARVQAVVNFVHDHIRFDYALARPTRTAFDAFNERVGVCRDFAHLAITLCRCLNIPARYCTGYLGDIGVPSNSSPMDFSAWFEVYLSGRWNTFDARHNVPRIGRVLIAQGRDAADVAIATTFGANTLQKFVVRTEEIIEVGVERRRS